MGPESKLRHVLPRLSDEELAQLLRLAWARYEDADKHRRARSWLFFWRKRRTEDLPVAFRVWCGLQGSPGFRILEDGIKGLFNLEALKYPTLVTNDAIEVDDRTSDIEAIMKEIRRRIGRKKYSAKRIERELRALYAMQSHMNTRDIVLSLVAIPALALLCFLVGAKLHMSFGHPWVSVLAALACGGVIWLIGRRWFALAGLIVIALLMILFEEVPDVWSGGEQQKPDRKTPRQLKLERAIATREAILQSLKGP